MRSITIAFMTVLLAVSCISKRSADVIKEDRDTIAVELVAKDSLLSDIFMAMSGITENLEIIKSREGVITENIYNGEIPKQATTIISQDIQIIDNLLIKNRETIDRLKNSVAALNHANVKIEGMEKMVAQLSSQSEGKDKQISELKQNLSTMNIRVEELETQVEELTETVNTVEAVNRGLEGELKIQDEFMNRAYYIIGSEKELMSNNVVYKSGFVGRSLKINEDHSLDIYTKIDLTKIDNILIGHKRAEIVTTHPTESYVLNIDNDNIYRSIDIIDKQLFWSVSKILVVSYK